MTDWQRRQHHARKLMGVAGRALPTQQICQLLKAHRCQIGKEANCATRLRDGKRLVEGRLGAFAFAALLVEKRLKDGELP